MFIAGQLRNIRGMMLIFLAAIGFLSTPSVWAWCSPGGAYTAPVTIQGGTYSAGEDMATGTNIRIQRVNGYTAMYTPCYGATYFTYTASGGTLYPGQTYIYQTGVNGLGVRFRSTYSGLYFGAGGRGPGWSGTIGADRFTIDIEFVKMGVISAGQINTSMFPSVTVVTNDAFGGVNAATYNFPGGTFAVQTPTCTTPDFNFDLGSYIVSDFNSRTPASPWVNTPVVLNNCPVFYGNNSNGSYTNYTMTNLSGGNTSTQSGSVAPNRLLMTLTPNTNAIDAVNGIVAPDGNSTATGVGIQIGNSQSGSNVVQNLNNAITVTTTPASSSTTQTFPLVARMIKVSSPTYAGSVSTSMTYTISYQ